MLEAEAATRMLAEERVDVTLPWDRRPRGARHPLTVLIEEIGDLFIGMGFEIAEGPELESEWYNFDALNFLPDHPARTMMDTFYIAAAQGRRRSTRRREPTSMATAAWCCGRTPRRCRPARC